jgi:uncharacterized protein YqeY
MSLRDTIKSDFLEARRARDAGRVAILSTIVGEIEKTEKAKIGPASDDDIHIVLKKLKKGIVDTLALKDLPRDRFIKYTHENELIDRYLPSALVGQELESAIELILMAQDLPASRKSMGAVMSKLQETYPGRVDGKAVAEVLGR